MFNTSKMKPISSFFNEKESLSSGKVGELKDYKSKYLDNTNGCLCYLEDVYIYYSTSKDLPGMGIVVLDNSMKPFGFSTGYFNEKEIDISNVENIKSLFLSGDRFTSGNMCHVIYDHVTRAIEFRDSTLSASIGFYDTSWAYAKNIIDSTFENIIYLSPLTFYKVDRLYFFKNSFIGPVQHPNISFSEAAKKNLKKVVKNKTINDGSYPDLIYQSRKGQKVRPFKNEEFLEDFLKKNGYSIIDTSVMSVAEQLSFFNNAKHIIAPHGAGLTSIFSCQEGTKITELFYDGGTDAYEKIASEFGLEYEKIVANNENGIVDVDFIKKEISLNRKIFQIGFNKSATVSLNEFFEKNGYKSCHWDKGRLSKKIKENIENNRAPLLGYDDFTFFSDMEHLDKESGFFYSSEQFYKIFDSYYPNSIFILNFRDVDKWVSSRLKHDDYLFREMFYSKRTRDEVINHWIDNYHAHIEEVKKYFKGRDNLILIDFEKDDGNCLSSFLISHGFNIELKEIPHSHKTESKEMNIYKIKVEERVNQIRDVALSLESTYPELALELMNVALKLRPNGPFIKKRVDMYEEYIAFLDK